jgi:hypothetical protein
MIYFSQIAGLASIHTVYTWLLKFISDGIQKFQIARAPGQLVSTIFVSSGTNSRLFQAKNSKE